jgi:hypothetical protein
MSGFKRATVTISQEEYRRLHEADIQKRFRKKKTADARQNDQQLQTMRAALDEMEERQRFYETLVTDLDDEIVRMEELTSRELIAYQETFTQELISQLEFASQESNAIFAGLAERFEAQLQRERNSFYQSLQHFDRQLERWSQDARHKHRLATQWVTQSAAIYDFIHSQFETERFAPGRMPAIHRKIALARANLDQGLPEASLQASQQAFMELSDLRVELETRTMEWQNQFQMTLAAAKELQRTILANAQVPALDALGNDLPIPIQLDYWSGGGYQILLRDAKQLHQNLREGQRSLSQEDLQRLWRQEIPSLWNRLESMIYEARLEAIQSQLRINIADLALQALETQGYTLQAAGFAEDDMRGSFEATLRNADQSCISIRILPKQGQEMTSDLEVISGDSSMRTAGELFARFQAIRSSLGQKGLTIRQVQANGPAPQTGNVAVPDRVRQTHNRISDVRSHQI